MRKLVKKMGGGTKRKGKTGTKKKGMTKKEKARKISQREEALDTARYMNERRIGYMMKNKRF